MTTERVSIKLPEGFDPNRHLDALRRKISDSYEGFELTHVDPKAGVAYATRETMVTEVAEGIETETFEVRLVKGTKPGDGDKTATRLEDQYPGYYLVKFEPFLGKATLAALSDDAARCRMAVSVALGVKPWDVQITERRHGGFDLDLPKGYVPSKHDDKLTEVAEAVIGRLGWTFVANPSKLTASILPGDPPSFDPTIPYPFDQQIPAFDATSTDWAKLPLGAVLGGQSYVSDFTSAPHRLISGTSGGGKNSPLTSLIPVPVSDRFPNGWALVGELRKGDFVYTASGTTTEILDLSPIMETPMYAVEFSDGQVVECGEDHLWKVSTAAARSIHGKRGRAKRSARSTRLHAEAVRLRHIGARVGPGSVATIPVIAELAGVTDGAVRLVASPALATEALIESGKPSSRLRTEQVLEFCGARASSPQGMTLAGTSVAPAVVTGAATSLADWATLRELADGLTGTGSTRPQRMALKDILRPLTPERRPGAAMRRETVYPVDEILELLAERADLRADQPAGREVQPLETVWRTADMAKAVRTTNVREEANFSVRIAAPFDGPDVELAVDPYVLGAWLGDGSTGSGSLTQGETDACTDDEMRTDKAHLIEQIQMAGYRAHGTCSDGKTIGTIGLMADLRAAGVLSRKHIPAVYRRASAAQRLALLQGLMDTDGHVALDGGCELSFCDETLAHDALELIRSLGIKCAINSGPASITEDDPDNPGQKRRRVTGTRWRMLFTTTTPVVRLPRKAARLPETVRDTQDRNYIVDITEIPTVPSRCLMVADPEHLYLTHGFIPTHNSILLQGIISGALVRGWELVIADAVKGGVDFAPFQPYVRRSGWGCETLEEAVTVLALAYDEGVRRKALVKHHGVQKWTELPAELGIRPVLVVTDEVSSFLILETVPKLAKDHPLVLEVQSRNSCKSMAGIILGKIARELRYVGIHLVVSSQVSQSATGVSTELRSNLGEKFLMGVNPTDGNRRMALNAADQVPKVPSYIGADPKVSRGVGVFEREGTPAFGVFKGYFATMPDFTAWLSGAGVPQTDQPRPSLNEVARSTPATEMPEERTPKSPKAIDDGGMSGRAGSSVSADFRPSETCMTCGVPIDPLTGNCRCSS